MTNLFFKLVDKTFDESTGLGCLLSIVILLLFFGLLMLINVIGVWLWGIIAVEIFKLPTLTFWQFFGLTILLQILIPHSSTSTSSKNN